MCDNDGQDIDAALRRFEAVVDKDYPEQLQMLEQMREHTRRLHQARGDWDKPSTFRNWNDPSARHEATPPLAIESYREYKNYVLKESQPIALIAAGQEPLRIEGPPSISSNPSPNAATQKTTSQT